MSINSKKIKNNTTKYNNLKKNLVKQSTDTILEWKEYFERSAAGCARGYREQGKCQHHWERWSESDDKWSVEADSRQPDF